jgi:hypothetical protein
LASTHTRPSTRRASAAHAPSYDWLRPRRCILSRLPSVAAVAFASHRCAAPPAVHIQLAFCVISYASSPPPSLHSCRVPPPRTWRLLRRLSPATTPFAWRPSRAVQERLAQLRRLLPTSSSSSSTSSTSSCVIVFLLCAFVAFIIFFFFVHSCRRPSRGLLRKCRSDAVDF